MSKYQGQHAELTQKQFLDHGPMSRGCRKAAAYLGKAFAVVERWVQYFDFGRLIGAAPHRFGMRLARPDILNIYRHQFQARCPVNGVVINYRLEIRAQRIIMVEDIQAACAVHQEGFHEAIAQDLVQQLGGRHILKAIHHGTAIVTHRGR